MYTILIVSSDEKVSKEITDMFPSGSHVIVAPTLKSSLTHASMRWDSILLDIDIKANEEGSLDFESKKPINNSYDFLTEAKDINPANEIIIFSLNKDANKCIRAMEYGSYNYLLYPFKKNELLALIDEIRLKDKKLNKDIDDIAYKYFIDHLDDRNELFRELVEARRKSGLSVTQYEFLTFFPMEENSDEKIVELLKEYVNVDKLEDLEEDPPIILVVEDELHVREGIVDILLDNGFDVLEAEDGEKAIEVAKEEEKIDLNLLDIGLPKKTGLELLPILKEIHPDSEAIMLTAFADQIDYVISCMQDQAYDYVTKPYNKNDLLVKISKAIQKKYFRKMMPELKKNILNKKLSSESKFKILTDIAHKREENSRHLLMKDIYLFFPNLEDSKIEKDTVVPKQIIDDGLLLFVDFLSKDIQEGKDCSSFIENWEQNF